MTEQVNCIKCKAKMDKKPGLWLCDMCFGDAEEIDTDNLSKLNVNIDDLRSEEICLCEGFRGSAEDTAIMKIRCNCNKCNSGPFIDQVNEVINHKYGEGVDHPSHYTSGSIEPIDAIEDWGLDFRLGNAVKYIARHKHKQNAKKDLEKAIWYIQRYIDKELTEEGK